MHKKGCTPPKKLHKKGSTTPSKGCIKKMHNPLKTLHKGCSTPPRLHKKECTKPPQTLHQKGCAIPPKMLHKKDAQPPPNASKGVQPPPNVATPPTCIKRDAQTPNAASKGMCNPPKMLHQKGCPPPVQTLHRKGMHAPPVICPDTRAPQASAPQGALRPGLSRTEAGGVARREAYPWQPGKRAAAAQSSVRRRGAGAGAVAGRLGWRTTRWARLPPTSSPFPLHPAMTASSCLLSPLRPPTPSASSSAATWRSPGCWTRSPRVSAASGRAPHTAAPPLAAPAPLLGVCTRSNIARARGVHSEIR